MKWESITLELLTELNIDAVREIHRDDIPESWVDNADTIMELTQYGLEHSCIGHTYAVKYGDVYIGVILLGEAILWETDPEEMHDVPFYRLMGFVIDQRYRSHGIGGYVLELVIDSIYNEYGVRPIALGVHMDNADAARFYEKHGFRKTNAIEGNDIYYLRYPQQFIAQKGRIALIPYTHEDDEDMLACWRDIDTQKGYNHVFQGSLEDLRAIDISSFPFWVVAVDRTSGAKIGVLRLGKGLMADLAIWIYPDYRGQGYGTEAFSLAVNHIFRNLRLRTIYAGCYDDNKASLRMLEKVGFRRYPAGDQQEVNCFTGEPTKQLSFIRTITDGIHSTKDYERSMFGAVKEGFNDSLCRWISEVRPDHGDSNCFIPMDLLSTDDIQAAIDANISRGLNYVLFSMNRPMAGPCRERFDFEERVTYVMAMLSDRSHLWQTNDSVEIRDIQTHDISADILDVSDVPQQHQEAAYRNMKMVLEVAKTHPEYHWLCAYKDGKRVGTAYAVEHNGFVEMDDLWVAEEYRHQRIATTIMKHIVDHTDGIVYLHATANATPKDMYAKMGFEIVETAYEYYLEW